jgi:hypothetical protein
VRRAIAPRLYSTQLSMLANLLRTVEADKRLTPTQFQSINASVNEIVLLLSAVQQKPLST